MALSPSPRSGRALRVVAALVLTAGLLSAADSAAPARADGDPVLFAAGDIGLCSNTPLNGLGDTATAKLIQRDPGANVAMLGDGAYDVTRPGSGSDLTAYQNCYGPSWGQPELLSRTRPTPGDNEYTDKAHNPQAGGYFDYFNGIGAAGGPAGPRPLGYYSYDLGTGPGAWHVVVLNSQCDPSRTGYGTPLDGCGPDSSMGKWLKADLAANPSACTLAYWHQPRFFSFTVAGKAPPVGNTSPDFDPTMNSMWQILQDRGADVVLNGHRHVYERFPKVVLPSGPTGPGIIDPVHGMREFVVGTGGGPKHHFLQDPNDPSGNTLTNMDPNSDPAKGGFRVDHTFGVLRLTLHTGSYDWQFESAEGTTSEPPVLDSGTDTCNRASTTPTTSPPATTPPSTTPPGTSPPGPTGPGPKQVGYWMVGSDGHVYPFGAAQGAGDAAPGPGADTVDIEPTPSGTGYWVVDSKGGVTGRGSAVSLGGAPPGVMVPGERATSLSATPSGKGYWVFTTRGRVMTFGDAVSYGDMSKVTLNGPVLDSIPTPSGKGYYMVASDGGIFAFGDAGFAGSMGGKHLNAPVQSLVPVPSGHGYWLVAADGGVFAFDAPFRGSMGATHLVKPVTGMVPYGNGYLMVAEDGGIFSFSDQPFAGSLGANPPAHPIVSVAAVPR